MKHSSRFGIRAFVAYAALCTAIAVTIADDDIDLPAEPMPLFSPPDSMRPVPNPEGDLLGTRIESKDELY
jgi:hypothetical protein